MQSPALRFAKSPASSNPIPNGCVFYAPLWHPSCQGTTFESIDPYGHLCTVTGALYGSQGRTFDKIDDVITVPAATPINNLAAMTVIAWINPTSLGESNEGRILRKRGTHSGFDFYIRATNTFVFWQGYATTDPYRFAATNSLTLGANQMVTATCNGSGLSAGMLFYVNGGETGYEVGSNAAGDKGDDSALDLLVGNDITSVTTFDGLIGDCLIYNRVLSAGEIQHIYNSTKGRYS